MKIRKHIDVIDKIATYDNAQGGIVCNNGNYELEFTFDEEWNAYENKRVRFTVYHGGIYKHIDVEFSGNICPVPPLSNVRNVDVGVFVDGAISTTTNATIECYKSALCGTSKSVYSLAEIEAINAALKGKDGKDGVDGIDGKTPYIKDGYWWIGDTNTDVKAEGVDGTDGKDGKDAVVAQEFGDSENEVISQKVVTEEFAKVNDELDDFNAWLEANDFDAELSGKTNVIKSPYAIEDMLNNSIILSSGNIRTDGITADKGNLMSPLIEVESGVYGLKVKRFGASNIIGNLGTENDGYGLFAQDGTTPVLKISMVDKGNDIYLITVPENAKYIRFVVKKGTNDDTNLTKALNAFNTWIFLPDATEDITDAFFDIQAKDNGEIDKIKRNDGSYLAIVDAEARKQISAVDEKVDTLPLTFGRRTCAIFKKVCCIGDSYTAGYIMNTDGTPISNNDYSWVEHIKIFTGRDYVNCGISGASARTWLTEERGLAKAQIPENMAQAYLIGLQINDASQSMASYTPVGSIEDIGTDAETYYGCMSKIVNEIFAINPMAHVFIQTQPKNFTGVHTPYREAVINIVSHFQNDGIHNNQVHLLDLLMYYKLYQNAGCNDSMVNGHFTAVGWEYCAEILAYAWSNYINQNPLKFQDVNLIPYGVEEKVADGNGVAY